MITAPLIALAAAAGAAATSFKRADVLAVEITSPAASISSVDGLKFSAAVTNTGSEAVKVLKYGTVLDKLPTSSFTVTKDGEAVDFQGAKVQVKVNDDAYTTIAAGETVTVEHDLSSLYNFASAGKGKFEFTPNTSFSNNLQSKTAPITVEITGDIAKREYKTKRSAFAKRLDKRATVDCSDSSQASFIEDSYAESKELANVALDSLSGGSTDLSDAYFSTNSVSSVTDILDAVATESDSSRTLSCTDEYDVCDGNVIAYTLIATTDIYYCDIFFDEVATEELCGSVTVNDRAIRGGTTLHEMTHAVADTDDVTYGCPADQALSASQQISNADNFNCFTTQVYQDTQC